MWISVLGRERHPPARPGFLDTGPGPATIEKTRLILPKHATKCEKEKEKKNALDHKT